MTHPDREGSTIYYTEAKCAVRTCLVVFETTFEGNDAVKHIHCCV